MGRFYGSKHDMLMLTVMRACEGCRRRKIKCDAATTNQWPCAACVRLKQHCVPPTVNYDRAHSNSGHLSGLERVLEFDTYGGSGEDDYHVQSSVPQYYNGMPQEMHPHQESLNDSMGAFHTPPYSDRTPSLNDSFYEDVPGMHLRSEQSFQDSANYPQVSGAAVPAGRTGTIWTNEQFSAAELSDVLGQLKINENGEGSFPGAKNCSLWRENLLTLHSPIHFPAKEEFGRSTSSRGIRG